MTIPKWLLPAISIVAALALGIAGTLIGMRFAATETTTTPADAGTVQVPFIAPDGDGGSGSAPGEILGTQTVSKEIDTDGAQNPLDAAVQEYAAGGAPADALADGSDPASGGADGSTPTDPLVDPCIDGGDPCPEGAIMSHIYALTAPPPFTARAYPYARGSLCPAIPGHFVGIAATTRPATLVVMLSSTDPASPTTYPHAEIDAGLASDWEDARAADTDVRDLPLLYACLDLGVILPNTTYTLEVRGTSTDDSTVDTFRYPFTSEGEVQPPTLHLQTVGISTAIAYTEHTRDQQVGIRAYVVDPTLNLGCGDITDQRSLDFAYRDTETIPSTLVGSLHLSPDFTQRTAYGFRVPEGSAIVFCAKWYRAGSAPSWERIDAVYIDGALLMTPDVVLPTVTIQAVDYLDRSMTEGILVARTAEGIRCGVVSILPTAPAAGTPLCSLDEAGRDSNFDVRPWSFVDVGFSGDIVIDDTAIVNGVTYTSWTGLPLSNDMSCVGNCYVPAPRTYSVGLPGHGNDVSAYVTVHVEWNQGAHNGVSAPEVLDLNEHSDDLITEISQPLEPQFDTDQRLTLGAPDMSDPSASARLHLHTDRAVDYTVTLTGIRGDTCRVGGATLVKSGHISGVERDITIRGLCFGSLYIATVQLTDANGVTATYSEPGLGRFQWLGSLLVTPRFPVTLSYHVFGPARPGSMIASSDLRFDTQAFPLNNATGNCTDGVVDGSGIVNIGFSSKPVLRFKLLTDLDSGVGGPICHSVAGTRQTTADTGLTFDLTQMLANPGPTVFELDGLTYEFTVVPSP
ncbi:MAG: hypothetical protein ABI435_02560 [Pseudolysinimonas sp.]